MGGYFRAALIALSIPILNRVFLALAGFLQLRSWSVTSAEAIRAAAEAPINLALVQAASVGVVFVLAFPHRSREGAFLESVYVRPLMGVVVALCFIAGVSLQFTLAEIGNLAQEIWPLSFDELARRHRLMTPTSWWGGMSALIAFVLVAPVTEELVFRGWLLPMLRDQYGTMAALLWSSLLFGLVHVEPGAIIYATLGGLVLGVVAIVTKSTLASIALHAGINATPLLLPSTLVRIEGFNTLSQRVEHISLWIVLLSFFATTGILWIVRRAAADEP